MAKAAVIALEDGACFAGEALAGSGTAGGELVFATGMTGYQEVVTDPSYHGQLVTTTRHSGAGLAATASRLAQPPGTTGSTISTLAGASAAVSPIDSAQHRQAAVSCLQDLHAGSRANTPPQ